MLSDWKYLRHGLTGCVHRVKTGRTRCGKQTYFHGRFADAEYDERPHGRLCKVCFNREEVAHATRQARRSGTLRHI